MTTQQKLTWEHRIFSPRWNHEDSWSFTLNPNSGWEITTGPHSGYIRLDADGKISDETFTHWAANDLVALPDQTKDLLAFYWQSYRDTPNAITIDEITQSLAELCDWINDINESRKKIKSKLNIEYMGKA